MQQQAVLLDIEQSFHINLIWRITATVHRTLLINGKRYSNWPVQISLSRAKLIKNYWIMSFCIPRKWRQKNYSEGSRTRRPGSFGQQSEHSSCKRTVLPVCPGFCPICSNERKPQWKHNRCILPTDNARSSRRQRRKRPSCKRHARSYIDQCVTLWRAARARPKRSGVWNRWYLEWFRSL